MEIEIERKFLFDALPGEAPERIVFIEQAYLNRKPNLRVRMSFTEGDEEHVTYELTYKGKKTGPIGQEEYNLPLDEKGYSHLKEKADGVVLRKRRHCYPLPTGRTIEADVFLAPYEGLKLAEVEFSSEEEARTFTPPSWFTEEVTGRKEYANAYLAVKKCKPDESVL